MSDKTVGERPPGAPSQRALGAMESAVRRARERAGVATGSGPMQQDTQPISITSLDEDPPTPPVPPWSGPQPPWAGPPSAPGRTGESARREHWLTISVAVVAVLVVTAGIALAVAAGSDGGQQGAAPPPSTAVSTAHPRTPPAAHRAAPGHHSGRPRTTTSTAPPATPGGPPVIASLSPARGTAGQGIQIAGSNFLSSSGQIVASFNGQVAPTNCPASNTCTVTVPPMSGSSSAQVTITTASGTSNAVTFSYS
ncbi:MAG TPA: IPT/TIG domain-containing protein [Acidimicrobiales bacterium]|nr:IPT/TIG domain-containing protein [Acidimicrobiales bacterium]